MWRATVYGRAQRDRRRCRRDVRSAETRRSTAEGRSTLGEGGGVYPVMTRHPLVPVVLLALAAVIGAPAAAVAAAPRPTAELNPAPPDGYTCTANGTGTVCHLDATNVFDPAPSGIVCGDGATAFDVFDQATRRLVATRWYDRDGNLVKRIRENWFSDARFSTVTGSAVDYRQHDTDTDYFAVPGDLGSATIYSQNSLVATAPGWGVVAMEAGRTVVDADGNVEQNGRRDLSDYFVGDPTSLDRLCAALGA
jgi:hypothetical protein